MKGMSLMELLVVLVIVGVLLMVSLPLYNAVVLSSNRKVAIAELGQVVARQEQSLQEKKSYAVDLAELGLPASSYAIDAQGLRLPGNDSGRIYLIELSSIVNGFMVSAKPQLAQLRDGNCGILSLQSDGRRYVAGDGGLKECW